MRSGKAIEGIGSGSRTGKQPRLDRPGVEANITPNTPECQAIANDRERGGHNQSIEAPVETLNRMRRSVTGVPL